MRTAVRIDPESGLKVFDTRAEDVSGRGGGTGYGVLADAALKRMPDADPSARFDAAARGAYAAYSDLRRGAADYMPLEGRFAEWLSDPHSGPPVARPALDDACEVLIVGAGFGGLLLAHKLKAAGFDDVRICEKAGDVGGTWYWNRYPGVACDVEAYSYLPLLEETGYVPSVKFASGFEILEHCRRIAAQFAIYDKCLFHTTVEATRWNAEAGVWEVETDRGDRMRARVVVLANGILTTPRLARIQGMETFEGESFHTSRWDHRIDFDGKRVGVIGTGATAVQIIPELARRARELVVFQRTPSSVDVRDQRETTDDERAAWAEEPGWARARRARFAKISAGRTALQANDDYLSGRIQDFKTRKTHDRPLAMAELIDRQLDANFRIMEQIRARVDAVVKDPATAAALKPYYPYGCKRPTFHDEFLPTFNLPHVKLVDTAPLGVREITARGVVHDGVEYPLDVLVYATGFEWMATGAFNRIVGRDGRTLDAKWRDGGVRTFLGLHSAGFPNLFVMSGPQGGGGSFNFTDVLETHADYVVWMLGEMRARGARTVDVTEAAEAAYARHCREADIATSALRDCPSYYNGEGAGEPGSLAYYGGGQWWKIRAAAQASLEPYVFGP